MNGPREATGEQGPELLLLASRAGAARAVRPQVARGAGGGVVAVGGAASGSGWSRIRLRGGGRRGGSAADVALGTPAEPWWPPPPPFPCDRRVLSSFYHGMVIDFLLVCALFSGRH